MLQTICVQVQTSYFFVLKHSLATDNITIHTVELVCKSGLFDSFFSSIHPIFTPLPHHIASSVISQKLKAPRALSIIGSPESTRKMIGIDPYVGTIVYRHSTKHVGILPTCIHSSLTCANDNRAVDFTLYIDCILCSQ